jgi:hypothetical protein
VLASLSVGGAGKLYTSAVLRLGFWVWDEGWKKFKKRLTRPRVRYT